MIALRTMHLIRPAGFVLVLLTSFGSVSSAHAHEFWIEPLQYRIEPGEQITALLRVGQNFEGDNLPWLPEQVIEAGLWDARSTRPIEGPVGVLPAISETVIEPGLNLLFYYSKPSSLTYTDFTTFPAYLKETGQEHLLAVHQERGLPATGFVEAFSRCAKSLVQVGGVGGEDQKTGLPLELVAEANPYLDTIDQLSIRLFWLGKPLKDAHIAILQQHDRVIARWQRTDVDGRVSIRLLPGATYLVSAVKTIPRDDQTAIVWHSYWASLTFQAGRK